MSIHTDSDFVDFLDGEFAWRRKELSTLHGNVKSAPPGELSARIRGATVLLYAHWEGFVKVCCERYIEFVARRRLRYNELNDGLLALVLRSRLNRFLSVDSGEGHIEFIRFLLNRLTSRAEMPKSLAIHTGANLNASRFRDIVLTLGLDYTPFELKERLIDTQLLHWRNNIAHGKVLCPKEDDFQTLYKEVADLLRNFKDQLANAVVNRNYRR
jgi:hypothetical protein